MTPRAAREAELDKDALRVAREADVDAEPVEECTGAASGTCTGEWTGSDAWVKAVVEVEVDTGSGFGS